jgi:hypothetical protein
MIKYYESDYEDILGIHDREEYKQKYFTKEEVEIRNLLLK